MDKTFTDSREELCRQVHHARRRATLRRRQNSQKTSYRNEIPQRGGRRMVVLKMIDSRKQGKLQKAI